MKRILIDCDPGVDDTLAILMALSNSFLKINSITTVSGNVAVEQATQNVLKILTLFKRRKIPVIQGANKPLFKKPHYATYVFEEDGLGGMADQLQTHIHPVEKDVVGHILSVIRAQKIDTIIALGPLTNIALAYQQDPETMNSLQEIVVMGGAIGVKGNITKYAEFNFFCDPHAASYVLQKASNITLIPLNVTMKNTLTRKMLKEILDTNLRRFIQKITIKWFKFYNELGVEGIPLHDPLVVGYILDKNFVKLDKGVINIVLDGEMTGMCKVIGNNQFSKKTIQYASSNGEANFIDFFIKSLNKIGFDYKNF